MNILSIQSHVAYGHVGNDAAVFPMQRLGHDVWPIHTVQFSNHTGYGAWKGAVFDASLVEDCINGIADRGVLSTCDGVISGYVGATDTGEAILHAVKTVKAANPDARYGCDPVLGDRGRGLFVRAGLPEFMRERAVPAAWLVTPNHFELDLLSQHHSANLADARSAIQKLHAMGPQVVMVTSFAGDDTPADAIDCLASHDGVVWRLRTPRLAIAPNGAGDAIAALFFVHMLESGSAPDALAKAGSSIYGLLKRTEAAGAREILLVAAQDEFVTPTTLFTPHPI